MSNLSDRIFSKSPPGQPFKLFGKSHLVALSLIVLFNVLLALWKPKKESTRKVVRTTIAATFIANEGLMHLWHYRSGLWSNKTLLPLHLCGIMIYTSCYMLVRPSDDLYQMVYFMGMPGAFQALLTPDPGDYDWPHYRFITTMVSHGLLVSTPIYLTTVEGYRPRSESIPKALRLMNLMGVSMLAYNALTGSNYMFLNRKPDTPSVLDKMGPWPVYLAGMEAMAVIFMWLVYLPIALINWLSKRRS
jgi:hypothetical integral membrane protein (TIGR02206 family)